MKTYLGYNIEFTSTKNCNLHGFAFWFDVIFNTDDNVVTLTTSPSSTSTHWKVFLTSKNQTNKQTIYSLL